MIVVEVLSQPEHHPEYQSDRNGDVQSDSPVKLPVALGAMRIIADQVLLRVLRAIGIEQCRLRKARGRIADQDDVQDRHVDSQRDILPPSVRTSE